MKKPKIKCRTCGGYCGKKKGQECQYAAKDNKRIADEIWRSLIGSQK
jgi:hypothetical protein